MIDTVFRIAILLAIFASVFIIVQLATGFAWRRRQRTAAVNKRLELMKHGNSREDVIQHLRRHEPKTYAGLPGPLQSLALKIQRDLLMSDLSMSASQFALLMGLGFALIFAIILGLSAALGFSVVSGILLLAALVALALAVFLPISILGMMGRRKRRKIEEQFPVSLDIFVRALRSGHPIASAIDLLTREMEDPIGSEYGLVADEVEYGADLRDALAMMAERWDVDDMRMFVVSLSVQNETGGNLAEILQNLSTVIRERHALYRKVRALSSEGRMTGWMLTVLPVLAFVGLFLVNPEFYLAVASDTAFIIGCIVLFVLYMIGVFMIRHIVDLEV